MDSELRIQPRMLCFLGCCLADTKGPGALYFSLPCVCEEGEKNGILWGKSQEPHPPPPTLSKVTFLVAPQACGRDWRASKTKTFASQVSDSALSYLQED